MTILQVTTMANKYNPDNFTVNGQRLAGLEVTANGYMAQVIGGSDGRREHLRQLRYVAITGDEATDILSLAEQYRFIVEDEAMPGLHVYSFDTELVADWLADEIAFERSLERHQGISWAWFTFDEDCEDEPYTAADYGLGPVL